MKKVLSFDDVLITPQFSKITSRKECNTSVNLNGLQLEIPILSANMDTITSSEMANTMHSLGGAGVLHRFCDIPSNVAMFNEAPNSIVSIGIGPKEQERVLTLKEAGATKWILDVAHGASIGTVNMYSWMRKTLKNDWICVGNFATLYSFWGFTDFVLNDNKDIKGPDALKIGVGSGSMCSTRIVTGCGLPTLASILDFKRSDDKGIPLIADGGIKNSGDIAKCLAAGASAVMVGSLLAGTDETPGELVDEWGHPTTILSCEIMRQKPQKKYRGSASQESYEVQGKIDSHRTPEGESTLVPYKGPASEVIRQLKAGLQSAMSYVGASNLEEFKANSELVEITNNGYIESKPHGKK